jgi:PqqD family protein of HPr-rel-A system
MQKKRFLRRTIDGEEIVVDLEQGDFYGLNETATRIVALWAEGVRDPGAIAERLAAEFDVEPATARAEVGRLLREARERGFLED